MRLDGIKPNGCLSFFPIIYYLNYFTQILSIYLNNFDKTTSILDLYDVIEQESSRAETYS